MWAAQPRANTSHTGKVIIVAGQIPSKGAPGQRKTTVTKKAPAKTPGKAVAKVDKDKLPTDLTPARAKALTEKIKTSHINTWKLLGEAALGRAWKAMGHKKWQDWADAEFAGIPPLPRDKRKEAVKELDAKGLSQQAIADVTGSSKSAVSRDLQEAAAASQPTLPNGSVPEGDGPPIIDIPESDITEMNDDGTGEFTPDGTSEPESRVRTDRRGREINTANIGSKPTVVNVVSVGKQLAKDIESLRIRLDSLFGREDYEENKVDVQGTLETAVGDLIDSLVEEFADLIAERAPTPEPEPAV